MKIRMLKMVIALLSTALAVGGVAMIGSSLVQIQKTVEYSGKDYLPAMQEQWAEMPTSPTVIKAAINTGSYIGQLAISSLKMKVNIFEGTENAALSKGAGHYRKSVMPGETDNSVIAGHRDTYFSTLGKIKVGALIRITTREGVFQYRVVRTRIVDKNDRTVIVPTDSATVTLSTCYPFRYIGSAPQRFIVSGVLEVKIV